MKKLLTTLTLLFTLCSFAFGQYTYYFDDVVKYESYMNIGRGAIYINNELQTNVDYIEIAAFINDEVRGRKLQITDAFRSFPIYGSDNHNDLDIIFKLYNHETQQLLTSTTVLKYQDRANLGSPVEPVVIEFFTPNPVAKVGNTEYNTIDEAVANWTNNTTLTLLSDVTLSDVITLKSTEHHILNLGSYTMTAASGKDAIQIDNQGRTSAGYALDINTDPTNPGGIVASGKAIVRTSGKTGVKDRPIIRFYNGVFDASYIVYHSGSNGTNCPQFYFYNGIFNGTVYTNRSLNIFYGGTFNGSLMMSVDSSAYTLVSAGRFKQLSNLYMSALNSGKFTIGSAKGVYDRGIYVDDEGYYVVGGSVITEPGETYQASIKNSYSANDYLYYSSAAANGLYYTDAMLCLEKNNSSSKTVNIHTESLDLTSLNYIGTLNISNTLAVTFTEGTTPAWNVKAEDGSIVTFTDVVADGKVTRTYNLTQSIAQIGDTKYETLAAAVEAAEDNDVITLLKDAEGSGVVIDKSLTIDFNGKTYTFTSPAVGSTGTKTLGFQIMKDNDVVLKNGTLNVTDGDARTEFAMLIQNYANLTITDMILDGDNLDRYTIKDYDYSYVISNNSGEVNIGGNTQILANPGDPDCEKEHYGVAFDVCKYASYTAPIVTLGKDVTVSGKVEICGGQLITEKTDLPVVVKKEFKAGADWGTISVPVAEAKIPEYENVIHDLYRYDEPSMMWQYYKHGVNGGNAANPFEELKLGQGYLYANAEDIELVLEGTLNVDNVVFPLSYTADANNLAGFNMVGNPFAYSIGLNNFETTATLAEGFYTIGAGGAWIAQTEGQKIAPMEAVLVKADSEVGMTIKAGQQSEAKRNQPKAYLAINVANAEYEDVAYVSFSEGMGLDKISHRNADVPMVSVPVEGREYAIAIMNEDVTEIPVTFKANTIGEYTFSAEGIECEFSKLTLVDRQTGNTTNLLLEDYTFMATSNDNANRFFLQIDNSQDSTDSSIFAYINNGMIKIDNVEGNGVVIVLDVLGRPVAEYDVQESANIPTASFRSGVYMIQMMDNNGVKVQKIIID